MTLRTAVRLVMAGAALAGAALTGDPRVSAQTNRAALLGALDVAGGPVQFPAEAAQAKAALERRSSKISPALLQLGDEVQTKGFGEFTAKAADLGVAVEGRQVLVTLLADDEEDAAVVRREAERRGAVVDASFDNAIFARMPVAAIEPLADVDELYFAAPQNMFEPKRLQQPAPAPRAGVRSEGVGLSKIEHLHAANVIGRGVKVGILDFGFQGLGAAVSAGELPQPKAVKTFGVERAENGVVHGTACAEIVHDMAPGADLYLAAVHGADGDIVAAAQWLVSQRVDIISFSGGKQWGPHNGTSLLDRFIDSVVRRHNILWVNAAGNEGDEHFSAIATDRNNDRVVEFAASGRDAIALQASDGVLQVLVTWDDWGDDPTKPASTQDLDAFLFAADPQGRLQPVAHSINPQSGRGEPVEFVQVRGANPRQVFVLKLRATRLSRPVRVHVYRVTPGAMEPRTAEGSVGIPATAREALAVGAVDVQRALLEAYSSNGPTDDGRQKPEVSASDRNRTMSYRTPGDPDGRFPGTSAACPHVSGFAALLKQLMPQAAAGALRQAVIANVRDMGPAGADNGYGHGHIDGTKVSVGTNVDAGGGAVEDFPEVFGAPLSQAQFERLWRIALDRPDDTVRVVTGSPGYRVDDGLKVGLRSDRDCHFLLVHRSSDGEFTVLSSSAERGRLVAGEKYALPEGETWKVQPPEGRDGVLLVCSPQAVDLAGWLRQPDGRVRLATATFDVKR